MNNDFCIISNNCWGGELYQKHHLPFNTPFIGLYVPPEGFLKICNDLHGYLAKPLKFIEESKYIPKESLNYPLALLGDVEIHFMHYKSPKEATEKWARRVKRVPKDPKKIFVKACDSGVEDRDKFSEQWNTIPYTKIYFSSKPNNNIDDLTWLFEYEDKHFPDGKELFKVSRQYINIRNWLSRKPYKFNRLLTKVLHMLYLATPHRFRHLT